MRPGAEEEKGGERMMVFVDGTTMMMFASGTRTENSEAG